MNDVEQMEILESEGKNVAILHYETCCVNYTS